MLNKRIYKMYYTNNPIGHLQTKYYTYSYKKSRSAKTSVYLRVMCNCSLKYQLSLNRI